nr:hypothetical protein [uncultured Desulfuromonas sp.]
MKTIGGRTVLMLATLTLWTAVPMQGYAADPPAQRNPFMSTNQNTAPSEYALAADKVRLHGLVTVGGESRAILSCPEDDSEKRTYYLIGSARTVVRVASNDMIYKFQACLNKGSLLLSDTNQKTYKLDL